VNNKILGNLRLIVLAGFIIIGLTACGSSSDLTGRGEKVIAYASYRDVGDSEVFIMTTAGEQLLKYGSIDQRITRPAWSFDGQYLAFVLTLSTDISNLDIYYMDADGSNQAQLTDHPGVDTDPAWAPNGNMLAFSSNRISWDETQTSPTTNFEVYIIRKDGTGITQLTFDPGWDLSPSWSPDGNQIVFTSNRTGDYEIVILNLNDNRLTNVTNHPADDRSPKWSPDGNRIVFVSNRDGNNEIYSMNPDGGDLVRLTDHPGKDNSPSWSPGSDTIIFSTNRDGNFEIYTMNSDGTGLTRLTSNQEFDGYPAWQH